MRVVSINVVLYCPQYATENVEKLTFVSYIVEEEVREAHCHARRHRSSSLSTKLTSNDRLDALLYEG